MRSANPGRSKVRCSTPGASEGVPAAPPKSPDLHSRPDDHVWKGLMKYGESCSRRQAGSHEHNNSTLTLTVVGAARAPGQPSSITPSPQDTACAACPGVLLPPTVVPTTGASPATRPTRRSSATPSRRGRGRGMVGPRPTRVGRSARPSLCGGIEAMKDRGVSRLVVQSSLGVGDSVRRLDRSRARWCFLHAQERDSRPHDAGGPRACASGLDWTILRPGISTTDPRPDG